MQWYIPGVVEGGGVWTAQCRRLLLHCRLRPPPAGRRGAGNLRGVVGVWLWPHLVVCCDAAQW